MEIQKGIYKKVSGSEYSPTCINVNKVMPKMVEVQIFYYGADKARYQRKLKSTIARRLFSSSAKYQLQENEV